MSPTHLRYTLDIARHAGKQTIRHHFTRLKPSQAQVIEAHELSLPGPVFIEKTNHELGDHTDFTIVYANPDFA